MKVSKVHCPKCHKQQSITGSYYRHNLACKSCGYKENPHDRKMFMKASEHAVIDAENEILLNTWDDNWSLRFDKTDREVDNQAITVGGIMMLIPLVIVGAILFKDGLSLTHNIVLTVPIMLFMSFCGFSIIMLMLYGKAQISVYKGLFEIFFGIGPLGIRRQVIWGRIKSADLILASSQTVDDKNTNTSKKHDLIRLKLEKSDIINFDFTTNLDFDGNQFLVNFINEKIRNYS